MASFKTTIRASVDVQFGLRKARRLPVAKFIAMDTGWSDFEFQFVPQNLTHDISTVWGSASSLSMSQPLQQWIKGDLETISFDAMFFAEHSFQNLYDYVEYLKKIAKKDSKLGRPPIWNFIYGKIIDEIVVIESLGGIQPGEPRSSFNQGTYRDVRFSIKLRKYVPYDIQLTDPNALPSDTFYTRVKQGDTWEHLAYREYGKARLGDILRRRNHDKRDLIVNDYVKLPKFTNIRNERLTPASNPLARVDAATSVRKTLFEARAVSKYSSVL